MKAAVLTVSDGVARGEREDESGAVLERLLSDEGYEVARRVVPGRAKRDRRGNRGTHGRGSARPDDGWYGRGAARRHSRGDGVRPRAAGSRDRGGAATRRRAANTARAAVARGRGHPRGCARGQPARLARRLSRRIRRAPGGAPARAETSGRRAGRSPADVTAPRGAARSSIRHGFGTITCATRAFLLDTIAVGRRSGVPSYRHVGASER